jgi:hypothetical protein
MIVAAHCENDNFIYRIVSAPKTKFYGNYLDILPYSVTRVTLKATGDVYALLPPVSRVNNLLIGRSWIDHFGDQLVINLTRGEYCMLTFNQCGWFSAGRFTVQGAVYSPDDEPKLAIRGKWNDSLSYLACDAEGLPMDGAPEIELWKCEGLLPNDAYNMTSYAKHLQGWESAPMAGSGVLSTDCRLRPDLVALREEDNAGASAAKHALEERQRAEKKTRTAAGERCGTNPPTNQSANPITSPPTHPPIRCENNQRAPGDDRPTNPPTNQSTNQPTNPPTTNPPTNPPSIGATS